MDYRTIIERNRDFLFWESEQRQLTFGALDEQAGRWRLFLSKQGLQEGDVVALRTRFLSEAPGLPFACWSLGLIFMPLDPRLKAATLDPIKKDIEIKLFIKPEHFPAAHPVPDVSFSFDLYAEKAALVILTSGSTGYAKCALLSLKNLFSSAETLAAFFELRRGERWLHVLPDFHIGGLAIWLRCFIRGATVVSRESVEDGLPGNLTHMSLVAAQMRRVLLREIHSPEKLRAVLLGGSAIPASLLKQALRLGWPVYSSYGLTEMASTVAVKRHFDPPDLNPADAAILPGRQVSLSGNEILLRGDTLFLGYYKNGVIESALDEKGWFASGDLGRLKNSCLTVTGRRDNMFVSGGENIQPEEIERHLLRMDGVENALVLPRPDPRFGQRAVAVVSLSKELAAEDIKAFLAESLPSFKIAEDFFYWPSGESSGIKWRRKDMLSQLLRGALRLVK